jgi:hypothetical protein
MAAREAGENRTRVDAPAARCAGALTPVRVSEAPRAGVVLNSASESRQRLVSIDEGRASAVRTDPPLAPCLCVSVVNLSLPRPGAA